MIKIIDLKDSNIDLNNMLKATKNSAVDKNKFTSIIPITSDNMFKTLFAREEYIKFPCKLLSYLIDISYEELLKRLHFTKNETGKKSNTEKSYRNDLVVKIDNTTINIEMNNNNGKDIRDRNFEYLMRIRGDKRSREYNQVIQVNLNNYSYDNDSTIRRDFAVMSKDNILLTNNIVVIDIYLPNIKNKRYNKDIDALSEMERFLLIGIEEDRSKALEYVGDDIVMKEFEEVIKDKSLDDDLYEAYDKEWALREQAERDGYSEGFENGKCEGLEQGIAKTVELYKMLSKNMSVEEISNILDIPQDKIIEIKNELL